MNKLYGIVYTDDGIYIEATVHTDNNRYRLHTIHRWNSESFIRRFLLHGKGLYLGATSRWTKKSSLLIKPDMIQVSTGELFNVCTFSSDIELHSALLADNLLGCVSDEVFLTTIPLYFTSNCPSDFLTIFSDDSGYLIGVTIEKRLMIALRMGPPGEQELTGIIARLERYWAIQSSALPLPDTIYWLGNKKYLSNDTFKNMPRYISMGGEIDTDLFAMKSVGVSICHGDTHITGFCGPHPRSRFRGIRSLTYSISLLLVGLCLLSLLVIGGTTLYDNRVLKKYRQQYRKEIVENDTIITLSRSSSSAARQYTETHKIFFFFIPWGYFLEALGRYRSKDLHLDRLGTKIEDGRNETVEIALTGWVKQRESVTDYIGNLKKTPFMRHIKLMSIERNLQSNILKFKIVCTIQAL